VRPEREPCSRCGELADPFGSHGSFRDRGDGYCEGCGRTSAWHAGRSCFCRYASGLPAPAKARRECAWCRGEISATARVDAVTCSKRCRQARHRFERLAVARARAAEPMRFAYADPPYPGTAARYYREHPDFAGEVDHAALLSALQGFDGWALSTSARALPGILAEAVAQALPVRVAAWVRGARPAASAWPLPAWEPVVFTGGRRLVQDARDVAHDALIYRARPRATDPRRVIGAKPATFCYWLFDLLGALPGDELVDVFPGSGGVARAFDAYNRRAVDERDASLGDRRDVSPVDRRHRSRLDERRAA